MTVRGSCFARRGVSGAMGSWSISVGIPTGDVGMATAGGVDVEQPLARSSAQSARRSSKRLIVGEIVFATAALLSSRRSVTRPALINIECPNCHARYQYDEERFERKPSKKIKCAKCATIFEIQNPAFAPKPEPSFGESTAARLDKTHTHTPL